MTGRIARAIVIVVVIAACTVLYGMRVAEVNDAYPKQSTVVFSFGDTATYAGENSSEGKVEYGDISITATSARLLDYSQIQKLIPGYVDGVVEANSASDVRALLIKIRAKNTSGTVQQVHFRDFKVQSRAWMNGLDLDLYLPLNNSQPTIVEIQPGEELQTTLAYTIYDTQFNSAADWVDINSRDFELALSYYPVKYTIALGCPETA